VLKEKEKGKELTCIISIGNNIKKLNFKAERKYKVISNYPYTVSLIDENGYKMNFSKREDDINLPYIWDYFDEEDKELLNAGIEKLQ